MAILLLSIFVFVTRHSHQAISLRYPASPTSMPAGKVKGQSSPFTAWRSASSTLAADYTRVSENKVATRAINKVSDSITRPLETFGPVDTGQSTNIYFIEEALLTGPCSIQYCLEDTIVNCSGLSLKEINTTWFPRNTTILLLDKNALEVILNSNFFHLNGLRVLNLSNNQIKLIQPDAFNDLGVLEVLNLENNLLSSSSYPEGVFDRLVSLTDLRLRYNTITSNLPDDLFRELKNLTSLTVDLTGTVYSFGNVFPRLTRLVISGDVKNLDSESFKNVQHITELKGEDLPSLSNFTDTALEPLLHLNVFSLSFAYIGATKALRILKPLIRRNMTSIVFSQVSFSETESYTSVYSNEGILNLEKTQYLLQICVGEFSLMASNIFVIEAIAFSNALWGKCLRSIDLSGNPLVGTPFAFLGFVNFKHLVTFNLEKALRSCYNKESFSSSNKNAKRFDFSKNIEDLPVCSRELTLFNGVNIRVDSSAFNKQLTKPQPFQHTEITEKRYVERASAKDIGTTVGKRRPLCYPNSNKMSKDGNVPGYFTVYCPSSLKYVKASRLVNAAFIWVNITFVNAISLVYLDLRDNGFTDFTGNIVGLDSLETLMLSGNDMSRLVGHFFDGMCNLVELDLSNCRLDTDFMANQSARLLQNQQQLQRLDISSNLLYSLKPGTFASNRMLEELDLSKNRFKNIPFNLKDTPNLKMLDLRENSLPSLEPNEREELDKLVNQHGEFHLLISGNVVSCGCESLRFLNWLAITRVRLDGDGNLTCMNKEGYLSYWSVTDDLEVFWRKCSGETFLALAVILFFFMVIGFLSVFLIWKNRMFLISKLLHILTENKLKRREDYQIGVYIGYADRDYTFPCRKLREFIEDELELSTYVYHRDADPSSSMFNSITFATSSSWRIVLVFSKNFLFNDEWSVFTVSSAIYALSPENPARVVVLVHENLWHRLPAGVLNAVSEENIIVVPSWEMSYDLREKLRTRLK